MRNIFHAINKIINYCMLFILIAGTLPLNAENAPQNAAIVVEVSGAVTYHNAITPEPTALQAFMMMFQGDLLTLPADARVKLLYPENGRKETWQGPVTLALDVEQSRAQDETIKPVEIEESAAIARTIKETCLPLIERGAVTIVRASYSEESEQMPAKHAPLALTDAEKQAISDARSTYAKMKEDTEKSDVTPELYLLSVLAFYEQYDSMAERLAQLQKTEPNNPVLQRWVEWVRSQQTR